MDTESVDLEEFRSCLKDLAAVNTVTLARRPTLAWLRHATDGMKRGERITLVDVGFGYGDMLRTIHRWCRAHGFEPDLIGVDLNPWSAVSARAATPSDMAISYRTSDIFAFEAERPVHFVVSSLFTHHLSDAQVAAFIRWKERTATRGWFINDLHRHPVAYHGFRLLAHLARWHRFVRHDGPVSIARGFRREDWARVVATAGLSKEEVAITWHVPFRYCVGRLK